MVSHPGVGPSSVNHSRLPNGFSNQDFGRTFTLIFFIFPLNFNSTSTLNLFHSFSNFDSTFTLAFSQLSNPIVSKIAEDVSPSIDAAEAFSQNF